MKVVYAASARGDLAEMPDAERVQPSLVLRAAALDQLEIVGLPSAGGGEAGRALAGDGILALYLRHRRRFGRLGVGSGGGHGG